jgi:uncharacterized protein DUF6167
MRRLFWVAVGAAAGVYAVRKVQKTLHSYSPAGLGERATGLGGSVRLFADEVRAGMVRREAELREALGIEPDDRQAYPPLSPADAADLIDHPAGERHGRGRSTSRSSP